MRRKAKLTRPRLPPAEALAAGGLFLACWGLVHRWFWAHGQLVDWPTYQAYGDAILHHGLVPYRDFAVEYPPGALPPFVAAAPFGDYAAAFAWVMAACGVALVFVVASVRPAAAFFVALSPVLAGSLILSRFDLWPALLAAAALAALLAERHRLGWALLGAAVAAKLWPLVLVPLALAWSMRRGRGWAALAGAAVVAAVFLPFVVLSPHGVWASLHGQASRPLQIESLGAAFFTTFGHPQVITSHGSQNVAGTARSRRCSPSRRPPCWSRCGSRSHAVRRLANGSCATPRRPSARSSPSARSCRRSSCSGSCRSCRSFAAAGASRRRRCSTLAFVLTQVWFPQRYWDYAGSFHLAGVVLARDLVLLVLLAVLVLPAGVARRRRAG